MCVMISTQAIVSLVLYIVLQFNCSDDILISMLWRCYSERIIYIMKTGNIVDPFVDDINAIVVYEILFLYQ